MKNAAFLTLKLALKGTVNNTDNLMEFDSIDNTSSIYFPIVKAEKDDTGWIFWGGTEKGLYLVEAEREDNDVICWVIISDIVLYFMSEFLFGQFRMDEDGNMKTRNQCRAEATKQLQELGYKLQEKE